MREPKKHIAIKILGSLLPITVPALFAYGIHIWISKFINYSFPPPWFVYMGVFPWIFFIVGALLIIKSVWGMASKDQVLEKIFSLSTTLFLGIAPFTILFLFFFTIIPTQPERLISAAIGDGILLVLSMIISIIGIIAGIITSFFANKYRKKLGMSKKMKTSFRTVMIALVIGLIILFRTFLY